MASVKSKRISGKIRNNGDNIILTYLEEVNCIPLLSKEEEEKVALLASQGDKHARERLANSNLRFVIMIAKKYQGKGLPLEDLIAEGNIGLVSSIDHFDVTKGCRFITYAVWWIRQAIIKALHEKSRIIRLPINKTNDLMRIERTRQVIGKELAIKNKAETNEIASFLDISQEKVENLITMSQDVISLDDPAARADDSLPLSIKDYVQDNSAGSPIDNIINNALKEDLEKALSGLSKRYAEILRCRFGLGNNSPMTLNEIGSIYKLSRERVRQIERRAITQLQNSKASSELEIYTA